MEKAVFSNIESLGKTGVRTSNFTVAVLFKETKIA
jgi:hypothetical protein